VDFFGHDKGHIPPTDFGDHRTGSAQLFNLIGAKAYLKSAVQDSNRGGKGPVFPDGFFYFQSGLHIFRIGHSVGNNSGFQGNYGAVFG
jgi:hypothetical protein